MSEDLAINNEEKKVDLAKSLNEFIEQSGLEEVSVNYNTKTNTATFSGTKDNLRYTTTVKKENTGAIKTESVFETNCTKDALIDQVKSLYNQNYTQTEIATMLGISQSTVSKYLNS